MYHVRSTSIDGSKRLNRASSVTLSEALDLSPTATIASIAGHRSSEASPEVLQTITAPRLSLQIPNSQFGRHLTLLEAITELEPKPEYTLEEALGSLYDEKQQDSSSGDSDVDIIYDPKGN